MVDTVDLRLLRTESNDEPRYKSCNGTAYEESDVIQFLLRAIYKQRGLHVPEPFYVLIVAQQSVDSDLRNFLKISIWWTK